MISKAMILGGIAAVVATGTGFYVATTNNSQGCTSGCPIRSILESKSGPDAKNDDACSSCCGSKASKLVNVPKPEPVDTQTLSACVGASAYATHPQALACCTDE